MYKGLIQLAVTGADASCIYLESLSFSLPSLCTLVYAHGSPQLPYRNTIRLPPSNHFSCSDVPSEFFLMILHTTDKTLITTTTPHRPTSQHLRPLPYHNKLYRHPLIIFPHLLRVSQRLRLSVTPLPSRLPRNRSFVHLLSSLASCAVTSRHGGLRWQAGSMTRIVESCRWPKWYTLFI